jgi:DNA-binding FadR family transcriptional regulator
MSSSSDPGFMLKEALIADLRNARWHPGQKLPTERQLCALHKIGRSAVRRALAEMKRLGLVTQTVGSGTYVAEDVAKKMLTSGGTNFGASPAELMEARLIFEPGLIDLAISNGTPADFVALETCCRNAETADKLEQFEYWDAAFHQKIAEATHNSLVISVINLISKAREHGEWGLLKKKSVTPERRKDYQLEHWAILEALRNRDAATAKEELVRHLLHVRRNMFGHYLS